jgi:hypothetical protein
VNVAILQALDRESQRRLRIFTFKVLIIIPVSVALAAHHGYDLFGILSFFFLWYSFFSGTAALFQRQSCGAPYLTAWDEMAAFLAILVLVRLLATVMA